MQLKCNLITKIKINQNLIIEKFFKKRYYQTYQAKKE